MNTKTVINIKIDKKLKADAQRIAGILGLPLGTIVNAQLRDFVREERIVFSNPPTPNKKTESFLHRAVQDAKLGKNASPIFASGKSMDAYLARQK